MVLFSGHQRPLFSARSSTPTWPLCVSTGSSCCDRRCSTSPMRRWNHFQLNFVKQKKTDLKWKIIWVMVFYHQDMRHLILDAGDWRPCATSSRSASCRTSSKPQRPKRRCSAARDTYSPVPMKTRRWCSVLMFATGVKNNETDKVSTFKTLKK